MFVIAYTSLSLGFGSNIPVNINYRQVNTYKFVFFDLGANNGDTILEFFRLKNSGLTGGSLTDADFGVEAKLSKWEVYMFEANPFFNQVLKNVKANVEKMGHRVYLFNETAAWTYDGTIDFYLDLVNSEKYFWGSSLNKDHPDVVKSNQKNVTVECKDIAKIIKQHREDDLVIVKMDIEGSEYDLLLDFLEKDVLKFINYLAVEFHPDLTKLKTPEDAYLAIFNLFGTKYINWN